MAEKQYISPIRLYNDLGIDHTGEIDITRVKKQLVVEFSRAKDGFIELDGYTYNRNDVMEEIERTDFLTRLHYHQRLWEYPFLLSMLEDNEANFPEVKVALDNFQNDPEFDEFFSPYFAAPFNNVSRTCINNINLLDAGEWLRFESFLLPADRETAFMAIRIFLDDSIKLFKNISVANYDSFRPKIRTWIMYGWHNLVNNLPHEYYHYKEEIAVNLVNVTVTLEKHYKQDSRDISHGLIQLTSVSPELRGIIVNNDSVYNGVPASSSSSSSGSSFNYWWLVWAVFIFARMASGGC